jgi:hypothetical protein
MATTPGRGTPSCRLARLVPPGQLLGAAEDQLLVGVAFREHDPQDLEHRVREVGVPAAGAEADESEHLAIAERQLGERLGCGDEVVERPAVPHRHELVPQPLQRVDVARPDRILQGGEADLRQGLVPGPRGLGKLRGQLIEGAAVEGLPGDIDDGGAGGFGERVRERRAPQAEPARVVKEGRTRDREPHPAHLGDDPVGPFELVRAQAPPDARGLVDDRPQAELHELIGGHHPGEPRSDHGDRGTAGRLGERGETRGVPQPVVVGEGKVGAEHGNRTRRRFTHAPILRANDGW